MKRGMIGYHFHWAKEKSLSGGIGLKLVLIIVLCGGLNESLYYFMCKCEELSTAT